jgi:prefoldin subunit 5
VVSGLSTVVAQAQADPRIAPAFKVSATDPTSMIAAAETDVANLSSTDLDRLQAALGSDPSWQQIPSQLSASIAAFSAPKAAAKSNLLPNIADFPGTFTDSCNSAGSAPDEFTATLAANEVQSAAMAALLSVPGVVAVFVGVDAPTGAKIALSIVWGIANAVFLALSQTLAVATDCAATAFANTQTSTFPTTASGVVQGSSELSVQRLITLATGTAAEISNVQGTVNAVDTQADTLTTAATNLNTTLNDINTRVTEVQSDLQTLQTNVAVLENTEVTVLNKANLEITNLSALQTTQVRMEIEANLSRPAFTSGAVALYQLPNAFGGMLETVQAIVTDVINKQTAVGHGSPNAAPDLSAANAAFAAGHYKLAYQLYSKAYLDVTLP